MARKGRNGLTLRVGVPSFRSARQHRACDAPYIRTEDAESGVLLHYASLLLPGGFAARVREVLAAALADEERSVRLVHEHLTKRLAELDAKEDNLLDLVEAGGAIAAKVRTRLTAIVEQSGSESRMSSPIRSRY